MFQVVFDVQCMLFIYLKDNCDICLPLTTGTDVFSCIMYVLILLKDAKFVISQNLPVLY